MDHESYYRSLPDYNEIGPYIVRDANDYEPPIDIPPFKSDFSTHIFIDNVPIVNAERAVKLKKLMLKIYSAISEDIVESDLYFPYDKETDSTPGFAFMKFKTVEDAINAVKLTNNHVLDKKHTFKVCLYTDLEKYDEVSDEFIPPPLPPFVPTPDVIGWLTDPQCRDQFLIRYSRETEICWGTHLQGEEPAIAYDGNREKSSTQNWCDSYSQWSPQGTYLATFHNPGIKLWGGDQFELQGRFLHHGVEVLDFSPCENYMVTYVLTAPLDAPEAIIVWDVRSGEKLRAFSLKNALEPNFMVQVEISEEKNGKKVDRTIRGRIVSVDESKRTCIITEGSVNHDDIPLNKVQALQDPNRLKWSPDGQYLARLGVGIIQIYQLPQMQLLEKKSLAAKDLLDFVWAPKGNRLSYWSPAFGNHPAMINIVQIPSRDTLCSRKVFDVQDGKMAWQDEDEFLCVRMTKISGKKKSYVLMIFRVSESEVPVEQIELTEPILDVQWEPSGLRFCVVHGETRAPTISFYTMGVSTIASAAAIKQTKKGPTSTTAPTTPHVREVSLITSLTGKQCNQPIWSPAGGIIVLAYVQHDSAIFEFFDVDNLVSLASRKHDRCNRLVWDPSGRILSTATIVPLRQTNARGMPDDGYNLYTFQGTKICEIRKEKLYQFAWRPRPKNILSSEEIKAALKNLKKYEKIFDKEDKEKRQQLNSAVMEERRKLAEEYLFRLSKRHLEYEETHTERIELRDGYDSEDESQYEIIVKIEEIVVSTKDQPTV